MFISLQREIKLKLKSTSSWLKYVYVTQYSIIVYKFPSECMCLHEMVFVESVCIHISVGKIGN